MLLVLIIICAFANFFFILNQNTPANAIVKGENEDQENYTYIKEFLKNPILDSWISMYMLTLGDFNYKNFSKGKDNMLLWVFFLLGTFICLIVFFNMVVAIMGNTFGNVLEEQEESALYE